MRRGRRLPEPHRSSAAHGAWADRTPHTRLCAARNDQPVCRAGHQDRQDYRLEPATSSLRRVPRLPRHHREECAPRTGRSPHHGQLRNPQDEVNPELAGETTSFPCSLHAHLGLMAELGGTLVRAAYRTPASPRRSSLYQRAESSHRRLHRKPQSRSKTLHLAQNRKPNPRFHRSIL